MDLEGIMLKVKISHYAKSEKKWNKSDRRDYAKSKNKSLC